MSDVFISYSRLDKEFVGKLREALAESEHDVWIDWESIPESRAWWDEIKKGIVRANNFAVVLSPNSMASPICQMEIEYALELNKRIIPIYYDDFDRKTALIGIAERLADDEQEVTREIWENRQAHDLYDHNDTILKRINYFFFKAEDNFNQRFQDLLEIINTDYDHKEQHTILGERASEWVKRNKDNGYLLIGSELQQAQAWLISSADKDPEPTSLHHGYIQASEKHNRQLQTIRRTAIGGSIVAIIAVILTISAGLGAVTATSTAGTSEARSNIAGTQEANAIIQANQANTSEFDAIIAQENAEEQANLALSQEANAIAQFNQAETAESNAIRFADDAIRQSNIISTDLAEIIPTLENAQENINLRNTDVVQANNDLFTLGETLTPVQITLNAGATRVALANTADARFQIVGATLTPLQEALLAGQTKVAGLQPTIEQLEEDFVSESTRAQSSEFTSIAQQMSGSLTQDIELQILLLIQSLQTAYNQEADALLVQLMDDYSIIGGYTEDDTYAIGLSSDYFVMANEEGDVQIREHFSNDLIQSFSFEKRVYNTEISPNNELIAIYYSATPDDEPFDGFVIDVYRIITDELITSYKSNAIIPQMIFDTSSQHLTLIENNDVLQIIDINLFENTTTNLQTNLTMQCNSSSCGQSFALTKDRSSFYFSDFNLIYFFDRKTFTISQKYKMPSKICSMALAPDDILLFISLCDGADAEIYDTTLGEGVPRRAVNLENVDSSESYRVSAFLSSGTYLVAGFTGSRSGQVHIWETRTGNLVDNFYVDQLYLLYLDGSKNPFNIITGSHQSVRMRTLAPSVVSRQINMNTSINSMTLSPDDSEIAVGTDEGLIIIDIASMSIIDEIDTFGRISQVIYSPNGELLALHGQYEPILIDANTYDILYELYGIPSFYDLVFSADSKRLLVSSSEEATLGEGNDLRLWDVETGEILLEIPSEPESILDAGFETKVAFSPDGQQIASGVRTSDSDVYIRDAITGELIHTIDTNGLIDDLVYTPDGKYLIVSQSFISIWDAKTYKKVSRIDTEFFRGPQILTISPNSQFIAVGAPDGLAGIWDIETGELIRHLVGNNDWIEDIDFTGDSTELFISERSGNIIRFYRNYNNLIQLACDNIYRDFTIFERQDYSIALNTITCS